MNKLVAEQEKQEGIRITDEQYATTMFYKTQTV